MLIYEELLYTERPTSIRRPLVSITRVACKWRLNYTIILLGEFYVK